MAAPFHRVEPVFDRRAFMLDISRDRVPTNDTLEWLVGVLQALRYNELQLYVEHTFTYTGHDVVWQDASPMTHDEMRRLDKICEVHGIDLVANMNCFGHMGRWLEHADYLPRAEARDGARAIFGDGLVPPACLAPTPANAAFGLELAREMADVSLFDHVIINEDGALETAVASLEAILATERRRVRPRDPTA